MSKWMAISTPPHFAREEGDFAPFPWCPAGAMRAVNGVALVDATATGQISFASSKASALLSKYFDVFERLPGAIVRCLNPQIPDGSMLPVAWKREGAEEQLSVRVVG